MEGSSPDHFPYFFTIASLNDSAMAGGFGSSVSGILHKRPSRDSLLVTAVTSFIFGLMALICPP